jgi:hypothetical protein
MLGSQALGGHLAMLYHTRMLVVLAASAGESRWPDIFQMDYQP